MPRQLLRFVVVGGIGFVVDAGGTQALIASGMSPLAARALPLCLAILTTWLLNRTLTFRAERPRSRAEFVRYLVVAATSALMNYLLYSALVLAGCPPFVAIVVSTVVLLAYSFRAYRAFVFR